MKKFKANIIIFSIIFLFCFVNCIVVNFVNIDTTETHLQEENLPKLSNNGINIITPENITYTKSMSGYYPATFGFENNKDNQDPKNFIQASAGGCTANVIAELGGRKKIIDFYDPSGTSGASLIQNFANPQIFGTIEVWIQISDVTKSFILHLNNYTTVSIFPLQLDNNKWRWYNSSKPGFTEIPGLPDPKDNTWYHVRLDFDCSSSRYMGLSQNFFKVTINGIESEPLDFQKYSTEVTSITLRTDGGHSNYHAYIDALGYSWDPNYKIGENLNEGLLLNYDNSTTLDWQGYSSDNQFNKTILGNTTIPMPEDGVHTIQVFGNDTLGTDYQSNIRYFTVDFPIGIITPEDRTYNKAMDGYYPGIQGFENTQNGSIPKDWIFFSDDPSGNGESFVIDEVDGHKNVVKLKHGGTTMTYTQLKAPYFNPNQIVDGTVEWWMYYEDNGQDHAAAVSINQGFPWGGSAIVGLVGDGSVMYYNGVVQSFYGIGTFDLDTWHHFKVDLNCTSDKYDLTVDGNPILLNIDFHDNLDFVDHLHIQSDQTSSCTVYYDAFGYSWEPGYSIGDNLNEGLLISFKNNTNLNWTGYSLDGSANRTIWGNSTIPLPHDGSHVIRVFGNDTSGTIYESNIRQFSVHHINIDTPKDKIYNGPMSGYYPATYGFENDDDGSDPEEWISLEVPSTSAQIISGLNSHQKVLELYDNSDVSPGLVKTWNNFNTAQVNGTIEFWMRMSDASQAGAFRLVNLDVVTASLFAVEIRNNDFRYYNGSYHSMCPAVSNNWYHLSVDFECSTGGYKGLNQYSCFIHINGTKFGPYEFLNDENQATQFWVSTASTEKDYYLYYDAIGYSWDSNYNIGDNIYEGLLLSFENSTALNWTGYSLDYQPTKTILGNTTFLMPENGLHTIQVFGNDSQGANYHSEVRHFTIDFYAPNISINLPLFNELFGSAAPNFNITVIGLKLDSIWYTIDAGNTNLTITEPTGMVNQTQWDEQPNGTVYIDFYANNTYGYLGFNQVFVRKDTLSPEITINSPYQDQIFRDRAPPFDISVNEGNLDEIWYTLDDGLVNITCSNSERILQEYWNALRPGDYILKFYANDTLGNLGFSEVNIKKREQVISVYNPIIIFLISIAGFAIIIHKIKNKLE